MPKKLFVFAVAIISFLIFSCFPTEAGQLKTNSSGKPTRGDSFEPPARIQDFEDPFVEPGKFQLTWTAPGDDGTVGTAAAYSIRYATYSALWNKATIWKDSRPVSGGYGTPEQEMVTGIDPDIPDYYFWIKTIDTDGHWSCKSNTLIFCPSFEEAKFYRKKGKYRKARKIYWRTVFIKLPAVKNSRGINMRLEGAVPIHYYF